MGRINATRSRRDTEAGETFPLHDWTTYKPSDRVLASKGKPARYTAGFVDSIDPALRERISVKLAYIDRHPHKDPIPKPFRLMPTEAEMRAAAARVMSFLVREVNEDSPGETCGERTHAGGPDLGHEAMTDGRCRHCDRLVAASVPEIVAEIGDSVIESTLHPYEMPVETVEIYQERRIAYTIHQITPDGPWESVTLFADESRHVAQAVIAGYLRGQARWAIDSDGGFVYGIGPTGTVLKAAPDVDLLAPAVKAPRQRKPRGAAKVAAVLRDAGVVEPEIAAQATPAPDAPDADVIPITRGLSRLDRADLAAISDRNDHAAPNPVHLASALAKMVDPTPPPPLRGAGAYSLRGRRTATADRRVA